MSPTFSAIFIFSGHDANYFNNRLVGGFPPSHLTPRPSWSLSHTLYRASPDPTNPKSAGSQKHLHILQVSNIESRTILCTSSDHNTGAGVTILQGAATTEFSRFLKDKLGVLWQFMKQGDMYISNGTSWEMGIFKVQIGDLLRDRGVASGGIENRGTVVVVSVLGEDDGAEIRAQEKEILQEFCEDLGLLGTQSNLKPLVQSWGHFKTWKSQGELWCDVLRKLVLGGGTRPRSVGSGS